ncbi:hypothetical protein [Frigoribacterium sp. Leaf164]|uniref:hypothetical protein n=1 Tax=Frigoribacterium sp. Leaf164 TaxID=1736282 RepID=UPI003514B8D5
MDLLLNGDSIGCAPAGRNNSYRSTFEVLHPDGAGAGAGLVGQVDHGSVGEAHLDAVRRTGGQGVGREVDHDDRLVRAAPRDVRLGGREGERHVGVGPHREHQQAQGEEERRRDPCEELHEANLLLGRGPGRRWSPDPRRLRPGRSPVRALGRRPSSSPRSGR